MTADWRLAVDIGGTFTDVVLLDAASGRVEVDKTLTTPSAPLDGVRTGVRLLLAKAMTPLPGNAPLVHHVLGMPVDPSLVTENGKTNAEMMQAHEGAVAQHQWVQQQLHAIGAQQAQYAQAEAAQAEQAKQATLAEKWPEYLSPETGPKLQQQLGSIMSELGLGDLKHADAGDILALKAVSDWRGKAQKYDTLMAQKMERVRQAKDLPKVSRPGAAQPKGAAANAAYQQDREAMKGGDMQAAARAVARFI